MAGGSRSVNVDRTGFLVGLDRTGADFAIGVAGGHVHSSGNAGAFGAARVNTTFLGAHGRLDTAALRATAALTYAWHRLRTERQIPVSGADSRVHSRFSGHGLQGDFDLSYGLRQLGRGLELRPFAGLSVLHLQAIDFAEGVDAAAVAGRSSARDLQLLRLGARLGGSAGQSGLTPRLTLAWQRAFGDRAGLAVQQFASSQPFQIVGATIGRDQALVDAGLGYRRRSVQVGLSYQGLLGSSNRSHGVRGDLRWQF